MKVLHYQPWVGLYLYARRPWKNEKRMYDVSKDIINGSVTLNLNQTHTIQFTLANSGGKYNGLFLPNDEIILFLKREKPIQVFTGFLTTVPVRVARTQQSVYFDGHCTMKKLATYYWDPYLHKHYDQTWRQRPDVVLKRLMDLAGWKEKDYDIQPFPERFGEMWDGLAESDLAGRGILMGWLHNVFGINTGSTTGTGGTGGGGTGVAPSTTELTNPNLVDETKLKEYMARNNMEPAKEDGTADVWISLGKKHNVNPALSIAIAMHESCGIVWAKALVYKPTPVWINYKCNIWGYGGPGNWKSWPDYKTAIDAHLNLLVDYLTPGKWQYEKAKNPATCPPQTPGTIAGIGVVYCGGNVLADGAWVQSVTKNYNDIMNNCKVATVAPSSADPNVRFA